MALPAIAALLGRSLAGATLRLSSVAATVGRSVKAASSVAGQAAVTAARSTSASPVASAARSVTRGRMPAVKDVLSAVTGGGRGDAAPGKGTSITQRIHQTISTIVNAGRSSGSQAMPQVSARELGQQLGGDPIARATADDWHARQMGRAREAEEADRAVAAEKLEQFAGGVMKATTVIAPLTTAAIAANKFLASFARARMEGMGNLRQYHGGIATDFIRLEQQRIRLDRQRAANVAGTSAALAESLSRRAEESTQHS